MKLLRNISLPLIASLALFACERDYDAPLLTEPEYTGPAANITISELRTQNAAATENTPIIITKDQVLKAVITGNDESGNIFKKIYLQDETGAIEMGVDQNSVYNYYPVGQTVYIDLNGLSISVFGGEQQLGHPEGYLFRTPWEDFKKHVSKDKWENLDKIKPIVLDDISIVNAAPNEYKFKLVQFTGVTFKNGGKGIFAPETDYGEEYITDSHGNTIMIRTSSYANFAGNGLPEGKGNITGILGRYNGTWQLTLRTANDVSDFTGSNEEGGNEGGETPSGETKTILEETFASSQGGFTIEDKQLPEGGTYVWKHDTYNDDSYMKASAFIGGSSKPSESWLVSPAIDLTQVTAATLTFDHTHKFAGTPFENYLTLWITEANTENWKQLTIDKYGTNNDYTFVTSTIDLSAYAGKTIKFAFKYVSDTTAAGTWEVKNVKVTATIGGSTGGDGGTTIEPTPSN
ncbi:DUF5689 domain-containing protein [Phocaeicola plebeius]|uniref:DUF5689 domain-containing protein n=1 Tax=Phocaeicola plebeius TaxID=310297 RepID=UPI00307CD8FC